MNRFLRHFHAAVGIASTSRLLAALLALTPLACTQDKAEREPPKHPFLWRIEGKPASYVYGTIHLPDPRVTNLPDAVEAALEACDVLLTEIDLGSKTQAEGMKRSRLPEGETLASVLPEATYARLSAYCESKRFPLAGIANQKPWTVLMMLPLLDEMKMMLSGVALDAKLVQEATGLGKQTGALETLDEQLGVFESFTLAEQAQMIDGSLDMLDAMAKAGRRPIQELIAAYRSGDLAELEALMEETSGWSGLEGMRERFEKLLITDRNHRMADRLAEKLRADPKQSHFAAVGALHHAGAEGVVELLRKKGFQLTRVGGEPPARVPAKAKAEKGEPAQKAAPVGAGRGG